MHYQDTRLNGKTVAPGQRECESRYGFIRSLLDKFCRPITILDVGASHGYFSFRIAEDYDATCIMIDTEPKLLDLSIKNKQRVVYLQKRITTSELEDLAACEHFDVVLALNVLHHFPDWRNALGALFKLGDHVVIETPPPDDTGACGQLYIPGIYKCLGELNPKLLGLTSSHVSRVSRPMWYFKTPKTTLTKAYFDCDTKLTGPLRPMEIISTFENKWVSFKEKGEERSWIPGINLRTYQKLNGTYPDAVSLLKTFELPKERHGDIRPWNFILSNKLTLIDCKDTRNVYQDSPGLKYTLQELSN